MTMNTRLIRLKEVMQKAGFSKSTIYVMMTEGTFPKPVKLGRSSFWPEHEVDTILNEIIAGAREDRLRLVANELTQRRKLRAGA